VTLDVGTLAVNTKRALAGQSRIQKEVCKVLRQVTRSAADTKRRYQKLIGLFIEQIATGDIGENDRAFLDLICERLPPPVQPIGDDTDKDNDEPGSPTNQKSSTLGLMTYLYSDNLPQDNGVGPQV